MWLPASSKKSATRQWFQNGADPENRDRCSGGHGVGRSRQPHPLRSIQQLMDRIYDETFGEAAPAGLVSHLILILAAGSEHCRRQVSAPSPLTKQVEEQAHWLFFLFKMMDHLVAPAPDPSPAPCQAGIAEQTRLHRHRIVAGHVLRAVGSFHIELVGRW